MSRWYAFTEGAVTVEIHDMAGKPMFRIVKHGEGQRDGDTSMSLKEEEWKAAGAGRPGPVRLYHGVAYV